MQALQRPPMSALRASSKGTSPNRIYRVYSLPGSYTMKHLRFGSSSHLTLSRLLGVATIVFATLPGGCSQPSVTPIEPCTTTTTTARLQQSQIQKVDLLLALDNSRSMADKQQILALAIPDLIRSLLNPRCIDEAGMPAPMQPQGPLEKCPKGTQREFDPILDLHLGVISTSIGGHGADSCPDMESVTCAPAVNTTNNDHAHLLSRIDPCRARTLPTYQGKGFLVWDPAQLSSPPGETKLDDGAGNGIIPVFRDMVVGVGQIGCGYESQLESIYRFLADPDPYATISVEDGKAIPLGTDTELLAERKAFLRPDSLLSVILLTDENDCSIKEFGQYYYVGQLRNGAVSVRLPRARQECAKDPNDPCCKSCGQDQGSCADDPTCMDPNGGTGPALLADDEDNINVRCWDQKRRFGIDFLYPTDRYVQAFSNEMIADRNGELVRNPIFSDLDPTDDAELERHSDMVYFTGIVGVPWQDIARDLNDLKHGLRDGNELNSPLDASGVTGWELILGNPAQGMKARDPHMWESTKKRSGTHPLTGAPMVDANMPNTDPINGHEFTTAESELEYACILPLLPGTERDCTDASVPACDCTSKTNDSPLCAPNPNGGNAPTLQVRAKAYPGLRPLAVIRDLGSQGIVGSVCAAQLTDDSEGASDYGYRAAVNAVTDRLRSALGGQCMQEQLFPNSEGRVSCHIIEARNTHGACSCDAAKARLPIPADSDAANAVEAAKQDPLAAHEKWDCFCELQQLEGEQLVACQDDVNDPPNVNGQDVAGWCYVDADQSPPVGNPDILVKCPTNERRLVRFVGQGNPAPGSTVFVSCQTPTSACKP